MQPQPQTTQNGVDLVAHELESEQQEQAQEQDYHDSEEPYSIPEMALGPTENCTQWKLIYTAYLLGAIFLSLISAKSINCAPIFRPRTHPM